MGKMWCYIEVKCVVVLLFLLTHQCAVVTADYIIHFQLRNYSNPTNTLANGQCCGQEAIQGACPGPCNTRLLLCLREADRSYDDHKCTIGEVHDLDTSKRGIWSSIDGTWPGEVQLYIMAQEVGTDHLIDNIYILVEQMPSDPLSSTVAYTGQHAVATIELQFGVSCGVNFIPDLTCSTCRPGYFGPGCFGHCEDTDNDDGHFTCTEDGTITCNEGYKDEASNCVACEPAEGCSPIGGYCNVPGECRCHPGYTGDNCARDTATTTVNEVEVTVQDSDSDVDTAPVIGGIAGGIFVFLMILAAVIAAVVLYKRQRQGFYRVDNSPEDKGDEDQDYVTVGRDASGKKVTLPYSNKRAAGNTKDHSTCDDDTTVVFNPASDATYEEVTCLMPGEPKAKDHSTCNDLDDGMTSTVVVNPAAALMYEEVKCHMPEEPKAEASPFGDDDDDNSSVCSDQSAQL